MRAVVQRVLNAGVTVDGECVGRIGRGYLVLLGVGHGDTRAEADKLWGKLRGLRINEDENGKTNLALADVDGEVLVVSQFTLFADCRHGRRENSRDNSRRWGECRSGGIRRGRVPGLDPDCGPGSGFGGHGCRVRRSDGDGQENQIRRRRLRHSQGR